MNKHKWHDVLIAIAEGRAVQIGFVAGSIVSDWEDYNIVDHISPLSTAAPSYNNLAWRVKPKEPLKRWLWAFKNHWGQNVVTDCVHTEEEFMGNFGFSNIGKQYCKLEWTLEESEE